jgi:hypothetical protein
LPLAETGNSGLIKYCFKSGDHIFEEKRHVYVPLCAVVSALLPQYVSVAGLLLRLVKQFKVSGVSKPYIKGNVTGNVIVHDASLTVLERELLIGERVCAFAVIKTANEITKSKNNFFINIFFGE